MRSPAPIINSSIDKLRQLTQLDVLSHWRYQAGDLPLAEIWQPQQWNEWPVVELNAKGNISWASRKQVFWLVQKFVAPSDLQGYPLAGLTWRLALTWWAEDVQIFVNGNLVQTGDLFDYFTRILLSSSVILGEEINVALRLVSPGHDLGALMRSVCLYEANADHRIEPGFVADELAVLQRYLVSFDPDKIDILANAIAAIDWGVLPDAKNFDISLFNLRANLQSQIPNPKSQIALLGHAHLDLAWLWPVSETWLAAQRTFESALQLQQDFPDLIFCHSTPALYAWIAEHRPDLFAEIQTQVKARRWEVVGGMWVEPELNLIAGESIVRQIFYGQRYVLENFQQLSTVAWLPDSFGFCATLPQFLAQGGIKYFVTQKLSWNDTTKFPYGFFWWQSPDGTRIFSLMSALIGETIDPIKMGNYAVDWQLKTGCSNALWLPGVGDHGGGPTRDMLEIAKRWEKSPFFPNLEFSTAENYLQLLSNQSADAIPVWDDELYLEFHRGCYTTHADQKRWNRRCEGLLYQAELFASLATLTAGVSYPKIELEKAWKKVLFNQFHDILPGTSITEVFREANQTWQAAADVAQEILDAAIATIANQIILPSPPQPDAVPIVVFNPLNWMRSEIVAINLPTSAPSWQVCDAEGKLLVTQPTQIPAATLLFMANDVPSVGYRLFWLIPQTAENLDPALVNLQIAPESNKSGNHTIYIVAKKSSFSQNNNLIPKDWVLENQLLRVIVNPDTGNLASIFDLINNREILQGGEGNQLQAFQDSGQYWDAWNIDPNYAAHPLPATVLKSIQWLEKGEVRQRLRVIKQLGESEFCQDYILDMRSPILKITTTVNWRENHVLVKAAFPLNLTADHATYEIPCGAINRTTKPEQPAEKAKWEVPALRWADLTEIGNSEKSTQSSIYGVSLLNDCKYGYDSQPNQIRLTLLRSPRWPDPEADQGNHEFTYALYPHQGNWQSAGTVRRGYELNLPLSAILLPAIRENNNPKLPPISSLLDLSAENLILMAFKQAENHPQQWILRCYECHGEQAQLNCQSDLGIVIQQPVDFLERPTEIQASSSDGQTYQIAPWKIASFQCISNFNHCQKSPES